jgi:hypothetical protein
MRKLFVAGTLLAALVAGCLSGNDAPDADGDGLSDAKEAQYRTNPNAPDTDLDGLSDGDEVDAGTNATRRDTDGDGTYDGADEDPLDPLVGGYLAPEVPAVDAAALLADHAAFVTAYNVRKANGPDHEAARNALIDLFESYGLEAYRHNFTQGIDQANIVGIKWGVVRDQWVVVGGHYDTTTTAGVDQETSQGAYDDGSGTFLTVHQAKAFSTVQPYYTMAFVAYDGEERGLQGASAFVRDFYLEGNGTPYGRVNIVGAVDLDMVGINWPGTMAPMNILSNSNALSAVADAKRTEMGWPDEQWKEKDSLAEAGLVELGSSDFAAFMEAGIPTIFFISDFLEMGLPAPAPPLAYTPVGVYPFWHQYDTLESMTAMAGSEENLRLGFQATSDVTAHILWSLAMQPNAEWDAA